MQMKPEKTAASGFFLHVTITAHPNSRTQENKAEGAADGYPPQELN